MQKYPSLHPVMLYRRGASNFSAAQSSCLRSVSLFATLLSR